jgi:hypothetical protein
MDPDTGVVPGPDSHTNICREQLAVKISGCAFRCCPVTGSNSGPEYLKSSWVRQRKWHQGRGWLTLSANSARSCSR